MVSENAPGARSAGRRSAFLPRPGPLQLRKPSVSGSPNFRPQRPDRTSMPTLRYLAAACQTDLPNPADRAGIAHHVNHMLAMIERAVVGYAPFGDVRLLAFPEFAHAAPIYLTVAELRDKLAVP